MFVWMWYAKRINFKVCHWLYATVDHGSMYVYVTKPTFQGCSFYGKGNFLKSRKNNYIFGILCFNPHCFVVRGILKRCYTETLVVCGPVILE